MGSVNCVHTAARLVRTLIRRIAWGCRSYTKARDDFPTKESFDDYLEEMEDLSECVHGMCAGHTGACMAGVHNQPCLHAMGAAGRELRHGTTTWQLTQPARMHACCTLRPAEAQQLHLIDGLTSAVVGLHGLTRSLPPDVQGEL